MALKIAFWILSIILLSSALYAINAKSVMRSCFALIITFLAVSGIFVTLGSTFLAVIQVMVYVGAVAVLLIMSVMMTHHNEEANTANDFKKPAILAGIVFAILGLFCTIGTDWAVTTDTTEMGIDSMGLVLFLQPGYSLLTVIAALIILTAIVGAITIAREK